MSAFPAPDPEANDPLADLVRAHATGLRRFLGALGCPPADADELAVEAFAAAHEHGLVPRSHRETGAWLRRTARYLWLRRRRGARREAARFAAAAERLWRRDCPDGGDELLDALRACLAGLDGRAAAAVRLCYREHLPVRTAAAQLGMRRNGLKTLLQRTRAALRACIERRMS